MRKTVDRTGEVHYNNQGCRMVISHYKRYSDCSVTFDNGVIIETNYSNIKKGEIKNPLHPSVSEVGYMGIGYYSQDKNPITHQRWSSMIQRCYDSSVPRLVRAYKDCSVHPDWHNFQNFAKWFEENYKEGFELDKDVLIKGNKVYSADTCCFVPQEINKLFTNRSNTRGLYPIGVCKWKNEFKATISINNECVHLGYFKTPELAFEAYKKAKEKEIKRLAKLYKRMITPQVYQAIYTYKVDLND